LVRNATQEFGFAPRDIYDGALDLPGMKQQHANKVDGLKCFQLKSLAEAFIRCHDINDISHHVVAVHPYKDKRKLDRWEIAFKSTRIARRVVEVMQSAEEKHLRETLDLLRKIPEASALAGRVFEAIVHRIL
jgi:hypothetical protein